MIDGEGRGRGPAFGVHPEDHRHGPLALVEHGDPARRCLPGPQHALQGLGSAVAVDQGAEGRVVLRRVAEAVTLDRADESLEVVALRVGVPALGLGERHVAQLETVGGRLRLGDHGLFPFSGRRGGEARSWSFRARLGRPIPFDLHLRAPCAVSLTTRQRRASNGPGRRVRLPRPRGLDPGPSSRDVDGGIDYPRRCQGFPALPHLEPPAVFRGSLRS